MIFDIESYLSEFVGNISFTNNQKELTCECPNCGKEKGHFYIHVFNDASFGKWNCFKCGESGDFWKLVSILENISIKEAKEKRIIGLFKKPNRSKIKIKLDTVKNKFLEKIEPVNIGLPIEYQPIVNNMPKYLARRKIKLSTARKFGLGFAVEGEAKNRIIFPIRCPLGRSWTARSIFDIRLRYVTGPNAGNLFFGWNIAFSKNIKRIVLCEGPMDALALYQLNIPAIALMRTSLGRTRANLINKTNVKIIIMLDGGEHTKALKLASQLTSQPYFASLPDGIDPSDATVKVIKKTLNNLISLNEMEKIIVQDKLRNLRKQR